MTEPKPKRGDCCPDCGRWIGPGIHGQTTICVCQSPLFYRVTGHEPKWISLQDPKPEDGSPLTESQAWDWFEAVEGRPMEDP